MIQAENQVVSQEQWTKNQGKESRMSQVVNQDWVGELSDKPSGKPSQTGNKDSGAPSCEPSGEPSGEPRVEQSLNQETKRRHM